MVEPHSHNNTSELQDGVKDIKVTNQCIAMLQNTFHNLGLIGCPGGPKRRGRSILRHGENHVPDSNCSSAALHFFGWLKSVFSLCDAAINLGDAHAHGFADSWAIE